MTAHGIQDQERTNIGPGHILESQVLEPNVLEKSYFRTQIILEIK